MMRLNQSTRVAKTFVGDRVVATHNHRGRMMRVDDAVEFFGTKHAMAQAIGLSVSAVYQWGEEVPKSRRESVRLAMKARAEQLETEAKRLRARAAE